jgi:hypothetical protein
MKKTFSKGLKKITFINITDMDLKRKHIKGYSFKKPDLVQLRELGALVPYPDTFREKYGELLGILNTDVDEGALKTLVRFYDPVYHCFTFVDYQLVPTLEEYSYWMGLPISNKVPYTGLEAFPTPAVIAKALHLKTADIESNFAKKGGLQGMTSKFLLGKASTLAKEGNVVAFEAILALLIYGLVLFPNIDYFVDSHAIQIFLGKNPVPTLLADTYHSIHHRTQRGDGLIICCAPLLYRWFLSHLPRAIRFKEDPDSLYWSQRITPLTASDIIWYNPDYDTGTIIDSCGEFSNVPLLGIRGGITYNPTLARRQFGYPMKDRPRSIYLTSIYYLNVEGSQPTREEFARAWYKIYKKGRDQLGRKLGTVSEDYTKWVVSRAVERGMPYSLEKSSCSVGGSSSATPPAVIPFQTVEEFQELLTRIRLEKDAWEKKYREADTENKELKEKVKEQQSVIARQDGLLRDKEDLIKAKDARLRQDDKRKKKQVNFFSSGFDPDFDEPPATRART